MAEPAGALAVEDAWPDGEPGSSAGDPDPPSAAAADAGATDADAADAGRETDPLAQPATVAAASTAGTATSHDARGQPLPFIARRRKAFPDREIKCIVS